MAGCYKFSAPVMDKMSGDNGSQYWHRSPYRKTGVQRVEWVALKLVRLLRKQKIKFAWREMEIFAVDRKLITVSWE